MTSPDPAGLPPAAVVVLAAAADVAGAADAPGSLPTSMTSAFGASVSPAVDAGLPDCALVVFGAALAICDDRNTYASGD